MPTTTPTHPASHARNISSQGWCHDDLHRLIDLQRGDLDGTYPDYTGIANVPAKTEAFNLDQLGNWFDYDTTVAGTTELDQSRTFNLANEITDVTDSDPNEDWKDPEHDAAGNTTRSPYIHSEADHVRRHVYDAWNRMVELQFNSGNPVWTIDYDGLNRLIVREKVNGSVNPKYDHYYNRNWQLLETHKDGTLHWQHVCSQRYIDAPVLWDRDTSDPGDGTLDSRYYFATDANMNVTAIFDETGSAKERYTYDAYGTPRMYLGNFNKQGNDRTNHDNHWFFAGYFKLPQDAYHVRHRAYHPTLGTWMQRDPLGYVDGMSLYAAYYILSGAMDPSGTAIITFGASQTVGNGGVFISSDVALGITITDNTFDVGITSSATAGVGPLAGNSRGLSFGLSNADSLSQLNGMSTTGIIAPPGADMSFAFDGSSGSVGILNIGPGEVVGVGVGQTLTAGIDILSFDRGNDSVESCPTTENVLHSQLDMINIIPPDSFSLPPISDEYGGLRRAMAGVHEGLSNSSVLARNTSDFRNQPTLRSRLAPERPLLPESQISTQRLLPEFQLPTLHSPMLRRVLNIIRRGSSPIPGVF